MEKLTAQQVRFIDTYLKKSGIDFLDVRVEMTDHVATAIEKEMEQQETADFYSVFKSYMVRNKKSLIKNATKHRWSVDFKVLKRIGKNLFDLYVLLLMAIFLAFIYKLAMPELEDNLLILLPILAIVLCGYFIPFILYYRIKISFLNRMAAVSYLLNYLLFQVKINVEFSEGWLLVFYGLALWINLGVIRTAFQMSAYYKKQYVNL